MTLREAVRLGEPVVGTWVSIGHPTVAEVSGGLGFDFVTVDTEHAPVGIETVAELVRAVDAADGATETVVRVPEADPVPIKRVLDTGAAGVMVPRVDTAAQAQTVVDATRYPPTGTRGVAAGRAADYGDSFEEYVRTADDHVTTIVQIETERAVENAIDVAAVDGVDALFVGPADLSAALDVFGEYDANRFQAAVDRVVAAGAQTDTAVGGFATDPDGVERFLGYGVDFVIVGTDVGFLVEGARQMRRVFEDAVDRS